MQKSCGLLRQEPKVKPEEKYEFIDEHPEYAAAKWADTLAYLSVGTTAGRTGENSDKKKWKSTKK
ncbi:MAG: hypothetical protein RJR35_01310 [Thermoanaerobacterales bacterium]|nr:hypothetical protein [Thermoanaerobacterales bacterium]